MIAVKKTWGTPFHDTFHPIPKLHWAALSKDLIQKRGALATGESLLAFKNVGANLMQLPFPNSLVISPVSPPVSLPFLLLTGHS